MQFITEGLLGFDSFDSSFAWKKPTGYQYQRLHNPSFAAFSRASQLGCARGYAAKHVPLKMEFATFRSPPERLLSTHQEVNKPFACQARSPTCYHPAPPKRCDTPRTERVRFNQRSHISAADITSDSQKLFFASFVLFQTQAPPESKRAGARNSTEAHAGVLCMSSPSFIPASAGAPLGSVFIFFASEVATPNLLSNYKVGTTAPPPHCPTRRVKY